MPTEGPDGTPAHGEERNRRTEVASVTFAGPYREGTTGRPLGYLPLVSHRGTVAEKWCAACAAWVTVGAGHDGGLFGFMFCPVCGTDWKEVPADAR